jgi:hypothetical protein
MGVAMLRLVVDRVFRLMCSGAGYGVRRRPECRLINSRPRRRSTGNRSWWWFLPVAVNPCGGEIAAQYGLLVVEIAEWLQVSDRRRSDERRGACRWRK